MTLQRQVHPVARKLLLVSNDFQEPLDPGYIRAPRFPDSRTHTIWTKNVFLTPPPHARYPVIHRDGGSVSARDLGVRWMKRFPTLAPSIPSIPTLRNSLGRCLGPTHEGLPRWCCLCKQVSQGSKDRVEDWDARQEQHRVIQPSPSRYTWWGLPDCQRITEAIRDGTLGVEVKPGNAQVLS